MTRRPPGISRAVRLGSGTKQDSMSTDLPQASRAEIGRLCSKRHAGAARLPGAVEKSIRRILYGRLDRLAEGKSRGD